MTKGTPALVSQLDLIEWFETEVAQHWGQWLYSGENNKLRGRGGNEMMGPAIGMMMNKAETVFISRDMCTLIEAAANTLPDVPIQEEQVFWPSAFIYFERPIQHADPMTPADGVVVPTRAIFYGYQQPVMDADAANDEAEERGLKNYLALPDEDLVPFIVRGLTHVTFVDTEAVTKEVEITPGELGTKIFPFDISGWVFGKSWETTRDPDEFRPGFTGYKVDPGLAQQRKLLLATLLIAQQYIAVRSSTKSKRQVRRRAERLDEPLPNYGDITYITLRRNSEGAPGEVRSDGKGGLNYRFPVKGHWRHQYYSAKGEHHLIWIDPYIKGPKNTPLIIKDKIYKLIR